MDMINGIGHRAQTNAIRQKQVKEELLKQEKASMQKLAEARLKKKRESLPCILPHGVGPVHKALFASLADSRINLD